MFTFATSLRNRFQTILMTALALPFALASCSAPESVAPAQTETTASLSPGVLNTDGFEGKTYGSFWSSELYTSVAGNMVSNLSRSGKQAMKFTWRAADEDGTNKMHHAELTTQPLPINVTERWYTFSVYLPSSVANDSEAFIFSQWHDFPDPGQAHTVPVIALSLEKGNDIRVCYRASNKPIVTNNQLPTMDKQTVLGKATFDQWVDYVVHVKYDPTGKTGIFQLWQNGELKIDNQSTSLGYVTTQYNPYWKVGLYSWSGKSSHSERTVYYDEVHIGDQSATYESMKLKN